MALSIPGVWIWDFWHVLDGDVHHLFFLRSPRTGDPEDRHWNVSIGHARSEDLRSWTVLDDALDAPAEGDAWDDLTTWTGSVVRHADQWWMAYTGTSHREQGLVQHVGLALSDDLSTWQRHGTRPLIEADSRWYELLDLDAWPEQAWRDPWVFRGDDGTFHCLLTARIASGDPATRGVIGHAVSSDLLSWEVRPPATEPGPFWATSRSLRSSAWPISGGCSSRHPRRQHRTRLLRRHASAARTCSGARRVHRGRSTGRPTTCSTGTRSDPGTAAGSSRTPPAGHTS